MAIRKDTLDQLLDGRDPKEVFRNARIRPDCQIKHTRPRRPE